jgi:glycosyltransferase involved in cell wall biosynthesis
VLHTKAIEKNISHIAIPSNIGLLSYLIFNASSFDIIHTHTAKSLTPCAVSKVFHSTKIVFSRRHYKTPSSVFSKWKYNTADTITTVSTYIKSRLTAAGITVPVKVIYDASVFAAPDTARIQKEYGSYLQTGKKIIAAVAAFEPEKDPHTLVKSIALLHARRNDFIFLHFGSGSLKNEIEQLAKTKGLQPVYFFPGQIPAIEELYSMFDVFVMTSSNEGFGSSVIDAFLNKVPVVSTNAGGLKELVENRGYLADVGNAEKIADHLNTCLDNPSATYINNAHTFAVTELSSATIQKQYEALFLSLAQPAV